MWSSVHEESLVLMEGFETFAERLAVELVEQGHSVTVYGQYDEGKKKGGITI